MAGTIEKYTTTSSTSTLDGYRHATWFGVGLAGLAVAVVGGFVRMPKQAQYRE